MPPVNTAASFNNIVRTFKFKLESFYKLNIKFKVYDYYSLNFFYFINY